MWASVVMVCTDLETARTAWQAGITVVLLGPDGPALGAAAAAMRGEAAGGPQVAVFVGDPGDETVWAAARTMAAELYGARPARRDSGLP